MIPRAYLISMAVVIVLTGALSAIMYPFLPDPSPLHWNIHGEADRFGPPWELAVIAPLAQVLVGLLMVVLPILGPFRRNFESFRVTYGRISLVLMGVFLAIHVIILLKTAGMALDLGAALCFALGLQGALLGNWLGNLRAGGPFRRKDGGPKVDQQLCGFSSRSS